MKRRVVIQRLALEDLDGAYSWVVKHAPHTASRWLGRFNEALQTLETNAEHADARLRIRSSM